MEPIREKLTGSLREKKKFHVGTGALVDLKAALFQKQEEFKKHKKLTNDLAPVSTKRISDKTSAIWRNVTGTGGKKNKRKPTETEKQEKARELSLEEERELEKSRKALEAKAALYEKLSRGEGLRKEEEEEEEGEERYLVDFTKKLAEEYVSHRMISAPAVSDNDNGDEGTGGDGGEEKDYEAENSDEEWVEYEDSFGRTRRCLRKDLPSMKELDSKLKERSPTPDLLSDDMQRERERRRWEQDAQEDVEEEKPVGPMHYQELQQGEIRSHGIGYYAFSAEEEKRTEQIGLLNKLREQTVQQRDKRQKLQEKRKAVKAARLAKVRERKLKQKGGSGDGEGGGGGGGVDIADFDFEKKDSTSKGAEGVSVDVSAMISSELLKAREMVEKEEEEKRAQHVRAWDRGKVMDPIRKRKQELHDERLEEFAPPSLYDNFKKAKPSYVEQDGAPNATPTSTDDPHLPTSDSNPAQVSTATTSSTFTQVGYPNMPAPPFPYPYANGPYPLFYPPPPPYMQHSLPYPPPPPPPPPPHVFPPHMYPPPPPPIHPEHTPNPQPPWENSGSLGAND